MENDLAGMISIASFLRLCYNPPIPLIDAENQIIFSGRLRPFIPSFFLHSRAFGKDSCLTLMHFTGH